MVVEDGDVLGMTELAVSKGLVSTEVMRIIRLD